MNFKNLIKFSLGGFLGVLIISSYFWYSYPELKLSFFISGNGSPHLDVTATLSDGQMVKTSMSPIVNEVPTLYTIPLNTSELKNLQMNISNYQGYINLGDVFAGGKNFKHLLPESAENLNIINNSANLVGFNMNNQAAITICSDCGLPPQKRQINYTSLCFSLLLYLIFIIICVFAYAYRTKLKEKLLGIYTLKNYALILPYAKPYWFRAVLAVLITIPTGMMDAVIAWSLKPFMDVVLVEKQTGWTMYIPLMIVIFSVLQALFTYIATYMNTWVGNKIALDIKRKLFNKLMHSDAAFFDCGNSGDVLFRFNNDAEAACSGLLSNMKLFTTRLFSSLSLIAVLFYNSWQLAIVAVIVMFGALMPLTKVRKRLKKVVCKDANALASLLTHYNEVYNGNRIITAYNLYDFCKEKFVKSINEVFSLGIQIVTKLGIITPIMHVISSFGIAFVIWYGSYLIVNNEITVGNFASFITSLVMLYNPIKSIGNNYNGVIFSLMAVERVFEKLNNVPTIRNNEKAKIIEHCKGNICYKNVSFEYVADKPVLKNVNLNIKSGQTIALVGNSGGGKTTISSLLPRFYDVKSGSITLDGINIKDLDINNLRDNIAIVFQDNFLFGGTIRENILFGRQDISEQQLQQAIHSACLDEFITTLKDGLDTQIGERGVLLSGGQKQRIAIARAFIKNAPILILDEATSALDNKSEAVVQHAIDNLMKDRTVMVIAHRLSTVRNADCIVVINDGQIVEKGSHDELLKKKGAYAALYRTQLA
mgnify:CR=1 FL=1